MLDPVSGTVIEVSEDIAPLVDELWRRLSPQTAPEAPGDRTRPDSHTRDPEPRPAQRGPVGTPSWRPRETRLIVPWNTDTSAKVAAGLPGRDEAMVPTR